MAEVGDVNEGLGGGLLYTCSAVDRPRREGRRRRSHGKGSSGLQSIGHDRKGHDRESRTAPDRTDRIV